MIASVRVVFSIVESMLFSAGMARLLILSSDTGEGHNSAARALEREGIDHGWTVRARKPLEESAALNRCLAQVYNWLLTHRPGWVGLFARTIDLFKPNEADFCYRRVRGYIRSFLESERPEAILSVHPMLNHLIQRWVSESRLGIPCYTFVTDPFPPFWKGWSSQYVDRYFVVSDLARTSLVQNGVAADRIERVSMPLRPGFRPRPPAEIARLRQRLGIEGEVILLNGGARGGGPLARLFLAVRDAAPRASVLVVCGTNLRLRHWLERLGDPRLRVFGFVEDIASLVGSADLVITKPGALSTYETLSSVVPAVLTSIGGIMPQESGLFQAARRHGFAFAVRTLDELRTVVRSGVTGWQAKQDAILDFYRPGSLPGVMDRIQFSNAGR